MKKFLIIGCLSCLVSLSAFGQSFTIGGAAGASSIASGTTYGATNYSLFTYYGFPVTNYPNSSNIVCASGLSIANTFQPIQVAFDVAGTNCELIVNCTFFPANTNAGIAYWTLSDGFTTSSYTNTYLGNGPYRTGYIPVTFATNGVHHLLFSVKGNFGGVTVTNGNTVSQRIISPKPNLLMVLGDSYTQGYIPWPDQAVAGTFASYWFDGWVMQLARLVPNTIALPSGIGGTGFQAGSVKYGDRVVSDICTLYTNAVNSGLYDKIFITASGTINDNGQPTNALYSAATNVYTALINACPQAHVFFVGNWYADYGTITATARGNDSVFSSAANTLNIPYYSPVDAALLDPTGTGNYSAFMGKDSAHPTKYGYGVMAAWMNANLANTFGTNWDVNALNGGGIKYYTLTVNNGTGSGTYTNGQIVSITASNVFEYYFTNWNGPAVVNKYLAATTVAMPASNVVVTANLVPVSSVNSINVTDYGAVGDVVKLAVQTTSNSPVVSVIGTNRFSSADIGKVIEVFRAGPWVYWDNNPASGVFCTNQDTICLITNVTDGTNLWGSIPQGWTKQAYCIVGSNNKTAIQTAINVAQSRVSASKPNITINIPQGTYLVIGDKAMNPGYVMKNIADNDGALTITSGGITFKGESPDNTILMGCGAGMEHYYVNNGDPNNTWPYGRSGASVPIRGTMFYCYGPVTNSQYPLVFQNLTIDGGLTNGLQSYQYWILHEGDGEGWDTTHDALLDINPTFATPQMHQLKVFTNCVFQHWRGEILKNVCGKGGTNTFVDIANCTFYDGNASANNLYFGQHVHGCRFEQLVKVAEYYQYNADLPTLYENNIWTNIGGNPLSIVGATTNAVPPSFIFSNNLCYGGSGNQISLSPAQNVLVISNQFWNPCTGVAFTAAGQQGNAICSNIVIACNNFHNTAAAITMDGMPVNGALISNNVVTNGANGIFLSGSTGFKTNIVLSGNSGGYVYLSPNGGSYAIDLTNNAFNPYRWDTGTYNATNSISYSAGRFHRIDNSSRIFYLNDSRPDLMPPGALLSITNVSSDAAVYMTSAMTGSSVIIPKGSSMNFYWVTGKWQTNSVPTKPSPPAGLKVLIGN